MNTRRLAKIYKQKIKQRFAAMDEGAGAASDDFFVNAAGIPHPQFKPDDDPFDIVEAWWMSELCRLVYTPDSKEFTRVWNAGKPNRGEILEHRTPFRELLDVHKTGSSAAIYEMDSPVKGTVLCFRGTTKPSQWLSNLVFRPHEWTRFRGPEESPGACVHSGFYVLFKRIWPLLWPTLRLSPRPWIFTGHSLGGAFAMFANAAVKADKVYTFGSPRIGNAAFASAGFENTIRIVNDRDIVPLLPAKISAMAEKDFTHCGSLVWLSGDGALHQAAEAFEHLDKQPWDILKEWGHEAEDIFQKKPPWVRDHNMREYTRKLAQHLPL